MKLSKKQQIISLILFLPAIPITLLVHLVKNMCYSLSIILESIGYKCDQFALFMGEKYRQVAKTIK